jgi:hypothetical protein
MLFLMILQRDFAVILGFNMKENKGRTLRYPHEPEQGISGLADPRRQRRCWLFAPYASI